MNIAHRESPFSDTILHAFVEHAFFVFVNPHVCYITVSQYVRGWKAPLWVI